MRRRRRRRGRRECRVLTELSRPRVSSMRKKMMAQKVAPGSVEMASG